MKICVLTQTATDISDYYKQFFKGKDLSFVTFKTPNDNALAYVPKSTWSDGRNKLWEEVRDKYDYYIFIDDDLRFLKTKVTFSALAAYAAHKLLYGNDFFKLYEEASPRHFFSRLEYYLTTYKPEVLSTMSFGNVATRLDVAVMRKNSFVRRLGWFDAQCTVLSNYAANKLLPYDTKISGWWSSQLPIYLYSYHVFGNKALAINDLATDNINHEQYVPDYNGRQDVREMLAEISKATGKDFNSHYHDSNVIDTCYGEDKILARIPQPIDKEDYAANFNASLKGIENMLHPNLAF